MEEIMEKVKKIEAVAIGIEEVKSSVAARDVVGLEVEERLSKMEQQMGELSSKLEVLKIKFDDYDKQWPALRGNGTEDLKLVDGQNGSREKRKDDRVGSGGTTNTVTKVSMAQKLSGTKRKIVVIGDSLARGVGHKLREQCGDMVKVEAFGGAKLGKIADSVSGMSKDDNRQLIVVAGANSSNEEPADDLLNTFERTIEASKKSSKEVVIVGLVKRYDLDRAHECKRIVVNAKLKKLCRDKEVRFVEYEPGRSRVHRDGLHLNFMGQNELGQKVFPFVKGFLV
jgi:lysophospholipase L1-like esterase